MIIINRIFLFLSIFLINIASIADVVKPALIEASVFADKRIQLQIDFSAEAAITEISTKYKKTTDAPNSDAYDALRSLKQKDLEEKFINYLPSFTDKLELTVNGIPQSLKLVSIKSDIVGYKKRPRKTILILEANPKKWPEIISWKYGKVYGDSAFRYRLYKKDEYTWNQWKWLRDGKESGDIDLENPEPETVGQRMLKFMGIGFDHVIPLGVDHILFIIGMALSTIMIKRLLILVTSFTLAHTITLGLAMYGVVEMSPRVIEPLIALSIAYIALENIYFKFAPRIKTIVVFFVGLVHGLGFATMLKDFKMTNDQLFPTLVGFNIGVELAQILLVLIVLTISLSIIKLNINNYRYFVVPISSLIGATGLWMTYDRISFS
jgi:hypothetical protein